MRGGRLIILIVLLAVVLGWVAYRGGYLIGAN
jgi:hypothetical protein